MNIKNKVLSAMCVAIITTSVPSYANDTAHRSDRANDDTQPGHSEYAPGKNKGSVEVLPNSDTNKARDRLEEWGQLSQEQKNKIKQKRERFSELSLGQKEKIKEKRKNRQGEKTVKRKALIENIKEIRSEQKEKFKENRAKVKEKMKSMSKQKHQKLKQKRQDRKQKHQDRKQQKIKI